MSSAGASSAVIQTFTIPKCNSSADALHSKQSRSEQVLLTLWEIGQLLAMAVRMTTPPASQQSFIHAGEARSRCSRVSALRSPTQLRCPADLATLNLGLSFQNPPDYFQSKWNWVWSVHFGAQSGTPLAIQMVSSVETGQIGTKWLRQTRS